MPPPDSSTLGSPKTTIEVPSKPPPTNKPAPRDRGALVCAPAIASGAIIETGSASFFIATFRLGLLRRRGFTADDDDLLPHACFLVRELGHRAVDLLVARLERH